MHVVSVGDSEALEWNEFVAGCAGSSFYHQYEWRKFYREYFKKESHYFLAKNDTGKVVGVLPLVGIRSVLFGRYFVSLPFVNCGGVLAECGDAAQELLRSAARMGERQGASHIEYRHENFQCDLPSRQDKVSMRLALPPTVDELGQLLGSKKRSQIRRSARENPVCESGGEELLDGFYAVFSRRMRDLGTPVYAKSMFRYLIRSYPKNMWITLISVAGKPASTAFLVRHGDTIEVPWAATLMGYNNIGLNMRLYWELLTQSIEGNAAVFDFGRSTRDSGTYRFKKQWGAVPTTLDWHYWLNSGETMPHLSPDNPKFALAIRIWRQLPLSVTNFVGPKIVRNLP